MSGKFVGFSSEEIHKIRSTSGTSSKPNKENSSVASTARRATINQLKQKSTILPKTNESSKTLAPTVASIPEIELISISESDSSSTDNSLRNALHFKPLPVPDYQQTDTIIRSESHSGAEICAVDNQDEEIPMESDRTPGSAGPFVGISLREYEAQRRMIEEQNRHKKEMIYKALEQRSKKTEAEAKQLQHIKNELAKIESDLEKDVKLLRKKIERASIQYTSARQYYEQIESVFLKAKLDMQRSLEQKDLLAEHLNIIITNTEDRKGQKLTELLDRMGLEGTELLSDTTTS